MAFLTLLIFLFLVYIRPQDISDSFLTGARLVLPVMALTILFWAIKESASTRKTKILNVTSDYWILALLGAGVLSTIMVHWISYSFKTLLELLKLGTFYFMTSFIVNDENRLNTVTRWLVFLTAIVCFIAILQRFGIDLLKVGMILDDNGVPSRIQGAGIFNNPNYLAYTTIFSVPFAFSLIFRGKAIGGRLLGLAALIIFTWAVIWTKSRGGLLCFVLVLFFLFGQNRSKKTRIFVNSLSIMIILLVITNGFGRMGSLLNMRGDKAIMQRIEVWYVALETLKTSPLLGIGYDWSREYLPKATHSSFVQVGVETGILGLFCWVGFLYFLFKRTRWLIYKSSIPKVYTQGLEGTLVAYTITAFFATMGFYITLFIIAGLIAAAQRMELARDEIDPRAYLVITENGMRLSELVRVGVATGATLFIWHFLVKTIG